MTAVELPAPSTAAAPGRTAPAVGMVLGSCVSVQLGAALATRLFPALGPAGTSVLRLGLAGVLLLAVVRPRLRGWTRAQWRPVLMLGLCMTGMNGGFYAAIDRIPLGTAVTIEFLGPLGLAALLSRRWRDSVWVLLAGAGVVVLGLAHGGSGEPLDLVGVGFAVLAGVCWSGYILTGGRVGRVISGHGGLAVAITLAGVLLLPLGAVGAVAGLTDPKLVLIVAGMVLLATVVPYSLELGALRRLPSRAFGVLLSLEPGVAALFGWLLLDQGISVLAVLAIGAVVAASIGSTLTARRGTGTAVQLPGRPADCGEG